MAVVHSSSVSHQLQEIVGRRVRERRTAMGVSQERLAEQLGYHRTYVGSVERGERNLTLSSLEQLAERLGVEPIDLLRS